MSNLLITEYNISIILPETIIILVIYIYQGIYLIPNFLLSNDLYCKQFTALKY